jgi:hypothetical protein
VLRDAHTIDIVIWTNASDRITRNLSEMIGYRSTTMFHLPLHGSITTCYTNSCYTAAPRCQVRGFVADDRRTILFLQGRVRGADFGLICAIWVPAASCLKFRWAVTLPLVCTAYLNFLPSHTNSTFHVPTLFTYGRSALSNYVLSWPERSGERYSVSLEEFHTP